MKRLIVTAMILAIAVSPLFRGLYFALEASAFLTVLALLSVVYLFSKLVKKEEMRFNKWILVFGFLLVAAYILSFIKATSIRDNISSIIQISGYWLVSIILYDYYHDKKRHFGRILMLSTVIAGFLHAIIGIEALSGAFDSLYSTLVAMRIGGTFQYANTAAVYFVICVVFSLTLINAAKNTIFKILLSGMGNIAFLALLLTSSRGGFIVGFGVLLFLLVIQPKGYMLKYTGWLMCTIIPAFMFIKRITALSGSEDYLSIAQWMAVSFIMAIMLSLVFALASKLLSGLKIRTRNGLALFGLLGILAAIAIIIINRGVTGILPQSIIMRFAGLSLYDRNILLRLTYFNDALKLISENWLLGLGGGGWYSLYQSVQDSFYTARTVHNHYLQVFVESGILGFLSFLSIIVASLFNMIHSWLKLKDNRERVFLAGLSCGFLALVLHSSFDFNLTYSSMALLLWALIAGSAIYLPEGCKGDVKITRHTIATGNSMVKLAIIIICSVLLSLYGMYVASAAYSEKGFNSLLQKDYVSSRTYYLKASHLDPINPVYHFQLAKIYYNYSANSTDPNNILGWREKARQEAETSVSLNTFYPEYREMLAYICFESDLPLEALDNTKMLISMQPLKNSNYELLAKGYLEAAKYYNNHHNVEKEREMLLLCSQVDKLPEVIVNDTISAYKQQALALLEK